MAGIARERCAIHPTREAVCRCPLCSRFYCRECVTEHDERLICSSCLARISTGTTHQRSNGLAALLASVAGFLLAALIFFSAQQVIALILTPR